MECILRNQTDFRLNYGPDFQLERLVDDSWVQTHAALPEMGSPPTFAEQPSPLEAIPAINLHVVVAGEAVVRLPLPDLEAGRYRYVTRVNVEGRVGAVAAEFVVS